MPDKQKQEIKSARTNGILARWGVIILIGFGLLVLVLSGVYLAYVQSQADASKQTNTGISRNFVV